MSFFCVCVFLLLLFFLNSGLFIARPPGQIIQNIAMHALTAARISSFLVSVIVVHSVPPLFIFFFFFFSSNSLQRLNDM